jgi:exopolysaccharide biosynthesis polyprenyl glycosylphosphotransferase
LLAERLSILQVFSPKHFALVKLINCAFLSKSQLAEELIKQNSFQNKYKAIFLSVNSVTELESLIKDQGIRIIVIDASSDLKSQNQLLINCLTKLKFEGIQVIALENFFEKITSRIPLLHIPGNWFLNSQVFNEISNQAILRSKRLFDIVLTLILSPLALLLIFVSALIIRITSKGAALYKQSRVGQGGKLFDVFKLRSMYVDAEKDGIQWTQENDTRITPFGKIIRATRIDELPQLWNILQGDMSFIGPRPERPEFVEKLKEDIPYYDLRHSIRPGLTGWAQINEPLATPSDALEKLEYDLFYIRNLSLWLEADIILKTIRVVLMRQGR